MNRICEGRRIRKGRPRQRKGNQAAQQAARTALLDACTRRWMGLGLTTRLPSTHLHRKLEESRILMGPCRSNSARPTKAKTLKNLKLMPLSSCWMTRRGYPQLDKRSRRRTTATKAARKELSSFSIRPLQRLMGWKAEFRMTPKHKNRVANVDQSHQQTPPPNTTAHPKFSSSELLPRVSHPALVQRQATLRPFDRLLQRQGARRV